MFDIPLPGFRMRLVGPDDAAFIVALRTDEALSRHLHSTPPDVAKQKAWIEQYKERELQQQEFYFIAETYTGEKLGLTRLYNFSGDTFELGSWIFKKGQHESIPVLADIAARDFAFETLGFRKCVFNVRKENKRVVRYHQLFKPAKVGEDDLNYYFELDYSTYLKNKTRITNFFSNE
jgi:RimJ/RimL family protein N-acetyltransferase